MSKIFVASFRYGRANLSKVEVEKETEKSFIIGRRSKEEKLLGWRSLPARISKEKYNCFGTSEEALDYLVDAAREHITACRERLRKAVEEHCKLVKIKREIARVGKQAEGADEEEVQARVQ